MPQTESLTVRIKNPIKRDLNELARMTDRSISYHTEKALALVLFPRLGSGRDYLENGVLAFPHRNYMLYYRDNSKMIEIIRIMRGSVDAGGVFNP